ncbi:ATP-dependent RNA helicase DDX54 [Trichinella pseudospiralis]|uniref:RNA helicase n=1 Tax=Trichinella pseudospiralis TaxID=6337 RepID=A0A0V0XSK2_TRIPS|nr:ATP-dependent RNA helicase DDX54 [Trichinella pseudospiralis]
MESADEVEIDYAKLLTAQNRKNKRSGGFQAMGLDHNVFKGIMKKGYKIPTPIQRKTIPIILNGKDVVAMARTGSGKTAAFLIPMFVKLKMRDPSAGIRAMIISPTRELALQTFKFLKELGKFTGLRASVIIGGDSMEDQFAAIHENPDVLIATPGRLLHVIMEMNLSLKSVNYVVFDEADRLFEMGFEEQLREVLKRLPSDRQTLLFSATLPKSLVDFTRAGLRHPTLIRLDVDSKLSDKLKLTHLFCRREDKLGILLSILGDRSLVEENSLTLIFCATKHYVEFLHTVLEYFHFKCACLYSSMDSEARRVNVEKFHRKLINILIVTDLAARGVDIPLLDNVINFHFPAKPKLFVHRVGIMLFMLFCKISQVVQQGLVVVVTRSASSALMNMPTCWICTCSWDVRCNIPPAQLVPTVKIATHQQQQQQQHEHNLICILYCPAGDLIGTVPQRRVDDENRTIALLNSTNLDLESLHKVAENSYKHYTRSRPTSSAESVRRAKAETRLNNLPNHPALAVGFGCEKLEREKDILLANIKCFRPQTTVFELNAKSSDEQWRVMKAKRRVHQKKIDQNKAATVAELKALSNEEDPLQQQQHVDAHVNDPVDLTGVFSEKIESKFSERATESVLSCKKRKKKSKKQNQDQNTTVKEEEKEQFFIPYVPSDLHSEQGLSVENNFTSELGSAVIDFMDDEVEKIQRRNQKTKWDRKRKKFVNADDEGKKGSLKKIRTESGVWIPASYKTDLYNSWKKKLRMKAVQGDVDQQENTEKRLKFFRRNRHAKGRKGVASGGKRPAKNELKSKMQIIKERVQSERRRRRKANQLTNEKKKKKQK